MVDDSLADDRQRLTELRQHLWRTRHELHQTRAELGLLRREMATMRRELRDQWFRLAWRPLHLMILPGPQPHTASGQEVGRWEPLPALCL